jgi:hypothetical protein
MFYDRVQIPAPDLHGAARSCTELHLSLMITATNFSCSDLQEHLIGKSNGHLLSVNVRVTPFTGGILPFSYLNVTNRGKIC